MFAMLKQTNKQKTLNASFLLNNHYFINIFYKIAVEII